MKVPIEDADRYIDGRLHLFSRGILFLLILKNVNVRKIFDNFPAPPLAFEVPVHENGESIIKKHPPKRFKRLEDQQQDPTELTHQLIDERQSEAEARRREILDQRIRSAKQRIPLNRKFLRSDAFNQDVS